MKVVEIANEFFPYKYVFKFTIRVQEKHYVIGRFPHNFGTDRSNLKTLSFVTTW